MPAYLDLPAGELARRAQAALARLGSCDLCPRNCGVDRLAGQPGACLTGRRAMVASWGLHFGEEAPLVGSGGSGAIFFAGCNLRCCFCQNYDISHSTSGAMEAPPERLAAILLDLQRQGAHNINLVTPSHVVAQLLEALPVAIELGLRLPIVYNTGGFDSLETLALLDGVVDIYLPDAKFWDPEVALRYCGAAEYPERARAAIREMHRQAGDLRMDEQGVATRGLLARHLVMPNGVAGTREWMRFLAEDISLETYVNVMDQYRPCGRALDFPEIGRALTREEHDRAVASARNAGLRRIDDRGDRLALHLLQRLLGGD